MDVLVVVVGLESVALAGAVFWFAFARPLSLPARILLGIAGLGLIVVTSEALTRLEGGDGLEALVLLPGAIVLGFFSALAWIAAWSVSRNR